MQCGLVDDLSLTILAVIGVNVNTLDAMGKSASYWAHEYKHLDIAQLLPPPVNNTKLIIEKQRSMMVVLDPPKVVRKGKKLKRRGKKKRKK